MPKYAYHLGACVALEKLGLSKLAGLGTSLMRGASAAEHSALAGLGKAAPEIAQAAKAAPEIAQAAKPINMRQAGTFKVPPEAAKLEQMLKSTPDPMRQAGTFKVPPEAAQLRQRLS